MEQTLNDWQNIISSESMPPAQLRGMLYDVCETEHAHCNDRCPVYKLNGSKVPDSENNFKVNRGCDCFKNGRKMAEFIRAGVQVATSAETGILMKDNYYNDWHKCNYRRSTPKPLSNLYPVTAEKDFGKTAIKFQDKWGKEITFLLTKEAATYLHQKLSKLI